MLPEKTAAVLARADGFRGFDEREKKAAMHLGKMEGFSVPLSETCSHHMK